MKLSIFCFLFVVSFQTASARELAFTFDDPNVDEYPLFTPTERNERILKALEHEGGLKAALFVSGKRIDSEGGKALLKTWSDEGHSIALHSYSHSYFPSKKITLEMFEADFLKVEPLVSSLSGFVKWFRFPFL